MKFLPKSEEKRKIELENAIEKQRQELADIKNKEKQSEIELIRIEKAKQQKLKQQQMKNQTYWLNKPASQRLMKLILDLSKSDNPLKWFKNHVQEYDSYNLKPFLKKLDEIGE